MDRTIPDDLVFFLLHLNLFSTRYYKNSLLLHVLNAARSCIAESWKETATPCMAKCALRINEIMQMDELFAADMGSMAKFGVTWYYWKEFAASDEFVSLLVTTPGQRPS